MTNVQIIDKVIPYMYATQIKGDLSAMKFPWYYISDVTNQNYGDNSGLTHLAFNFGNPPSEWYPFLMPLVYSIAEAGGHELDQLLRIRVGCLNQTVNINYKHNTPHIDFMMPHYTACYYVNDSDGDTVVFDQTTKDIGTTNLDEEVLQNYVARTTFTVADQATPQCGRVCIFNGLQFHASTKPKEHDRRIVITINYIAK